MKWPVSFQLHKKYGTYSKVTVYRRYLHVIVRKLLYPAIRAMKITTTIFEWIFQLNLAAHDHLS